MSSRAVRVGAAVVFGGLLLLYSVGAWKTEPSSDPSALDLNVLQEWVHRGLSGSPPTRPGHLAKPGYLLLLHALLPHGPDPSSLRRIIWGNALWIAGSCLAAAAALWKRHGPGSATALAGLTLVALPLRDAADYVASEPIAIGFAFVACALLIARPSAVIVGALGALLAAFALIRPNTSYFLATLSLLVIASQKGLRRASALVAGFLVMLCMEIAGGALAGMNLNPLSLTSADAALFGTAHYGWPGDLPNRGPESPPNRLTADRWKSFLNETPRDRNRFLAWRTTHVVLSAEQFPGRWQSVYGRVDLTVRQWWCLVGIAWSCAAAACASGGRGPWRWVPLLTLLLCIVQSLAFGAEQRYALPLLPVALVAIVLTLPTISVTRRVIVASTGPLLAAILAIREASDTSASNYSVVRGGGRTIRQVVTSWPRGGSAGATLHVRLLIPSDSLLGFELSVNQTPVMRKEPGENFPPPAYLSIRLDPHTVKEMESGCSISIRTLEPENAPQSFHPFLYFPVVPAILGESATLDGDPHLPTISGSSIRGGIPIWVHEGFD